MKFILSLICIASCCIVRSQNLVPNPSFEEFSDCPFSISELQNLCENWMSWSESPDYFNACNNEINEFAGVPINAFGFQQALSGVAYSSFVSYAFTDPNIREYMAVQLSQDVTVGEEYYVMFFASLYDGGSQSDFHCATNHIGLRFFEDPMYDFDSNPLEPDNFAHLDFTEVFLNDTSWVKIDGWITADQEYNWLAIGNFFTDQNTTIEILDDGDECFGIYYIENVCVSPTQEGCDQLLSSNSLNSSSRLKVYPNPSTSTLTIESPTDIIHSLKLMDLSGQILWDQKPNNSNSVQINITDYADGLYYLQVRTENEFYTHRILKQ